MAAAYIDFSRKFKRRSMLLGDTWERITTTSDTVTINDGPIRVIYEWSVFSRVETFPDSIWLISAKGSFRIPLYAGSFTIGTATEFIEFMKTDHPEIPIKSTASFSKSGEAPR
jgi:hypothetical protein